MFKMTSNLFTNENGVIGSKSRLSDINIINGSIKKPILLLPTNCFTKLLILKANEKVIYAGTDITLNNIQILSRRPTVRKVIKPCAICKQFQEKPPPAPSPL